MTKSSPAAAGMLARIPGTDDAMQIVTREAASQEHPAPARPDFFHGFLRITWPAAPKAGENRALVAWKTSLSALIYAEDGSIRHDGPLTTASKITVHADPDGWIWAELEMLATPDGQFLTGTEKDPGTGRPLIYPREDGGGCITGTFAFLITSMKTAQP